MKVAANKVELTGFRVADLYDPKQMKFVAVRAGQDVHITVERDPSQADDAVVNAVAHAFADEKAPLANLVAEYWKPWITGEFEMVPQQGKADCMRFKGRAQRTEDGDIVIPCEEQALSKGGGQQAFDPSFLPYRVGKGVTPPKAISAPDPQYIELARLYKLQGTTVLELTVSTAGNPVNILITRPLGFGLDDQAVAAVRS